MTDLLIIANGRLRHGCGGRRWDRLTIRLRELLGNRVEIHFTSKRGEAIQRAREALLAGVGWLAAAGGDGTIHEVVNGFFDKDRNIRPQASLSVLPCGSGNDWVRTLGMAPDLSMAVERLAHASVRTVDVGLIRFQGLGGSAEERVFINIAEAGIGGKVVAGMDGSSRIMPNRLSYLLRALVAALTYTPRRVQLVLDGKTSVATEPLLSLIVAGGGYFGGGMHCAPMARPDDGLLEVITIGDFGILEILMKLRRFVAGDYLGDPKVAHYSVRSLKARSGEKIPLELDGETAGYLPCDIRLLPRALRVRC